LSANTLGHRTPNVPRGEAKGLHLADFVEKVEDTADAKFSQKLARF
jgi:hypothetical protein